MKKISILSLHLGFGGIEKSICSLANMLSAKYDVEIICCYKLYDKCCFKLNDNVKVTYLNDESVVPNRDLFVKAIHSFNIVNIFKEGFKSIKVLYLRKSKMCSYLKSCNSDIVVSTRDIFNFWSGKYLKPNIIKIGWEHNHFHNNIKYAEKIVKSVEKLDYFVLVSSNLEKYYSDRLKNSQVKCLFIPNTIDELPDKCSNLSSKRFISVGRLSTEKGYLDLLKIIGMVNKKYSDWTLDIIGDGNQRELLQEYIDSNKLTNVVLHGFQDKDYINRLLSKSSIYLMTSFTESFGIVLIEAMSFGIPCIAFSSAEGACEIIKDGENGYLVDNRDFDAMVKRIEELIKDKEKRIKMGKCARESVSKYTSSVVSKKWIKLIEKSGKDG